MKVFICLLVTIAACNATFFSGLGGGKTVTYNVVAKPTSLGHSLGGGGGGGGGGGHHVHSHGHGHVHSYVQSFGHGHGAGHGYGHGSSHSYAVAPQVIKVIVEEERGLGGAGASLQSYGGSYGSSYGGGYSSGYGGNLGGSYAVAPQEEIIQVIQEHAPISHSYSGGGHGGSYAVVDAGHSYGSGYVHNSHGSIGGSLGGSIGGGGGALQLNSVLPQILQIIEQEGGAYGGYGAYGSGGGHYAQLIDAFGHHGTAYVTPVKKGQHSHLSGGHIIEKGVLQFNKGKVHGGDGVNLAGTGLGDLLTQLSNLKVSKGSGGGGIGGGHGGGSIKSGW